MFPNIEFKISGKLGRKGYSLNTDNSSSNKEVTCTGFITKNASSFEVDLL